jgi:hypothetical protein
VDVVPGADSSDERIRDGLAKWWVRPVGNVPGHESWPASPSGTKFCRTMANPASSHCAEVAASAWLQILLLFGGSGLPCPRRAEFRRDRLALTQLFRDVMSGKAIDE